MIRLHPVRIAVFTCICVLASNFAVAGAKGPEPDAYEPDNSQAAAGVIDFGQVQTRSIHAAGDRDYVSFFVSLAGDVVISASSAGDAALALYGEDGRQVAAADGSAQGAPARIETKLQPGTYTIEVAEKGDDAAIPTYELALDDGTPVTKATTYYALMVGIDEYDPAYGASSLPSCVNDAEGMRSAFLVDSARWSSGNITTLTDSSATEAAISSQLATLAATAVSGDVVVYFHSSHGGQSSGTDTFLCAHDASYTDAELAADLANFADGVTVIVIVDACHSGGLFQSADSGGRGGWDLAANTMRQLNLRVAKSGTKAPSIGWITACDYDETCWAGNPYSLFTGYLISAFTNGDANSDLDVTFRELFDYADPRATADNSGQDGQILNSAVLASTIAVGVSSSGGADAYEHDDSFSGASSINDGDSQTRSIHDLGDQDYVAFSVSEDSTVTITTAGTSGDTVLVLYDSGQNQLAYDDDGGVSDFSLISEDLSAGNYYIRVYEYGNNATIDSYTLALSIDEDDDYTILPDDDDDDAWYEDGCRMSAGPTAGWLQLLPVLGALALIAVGRRRVTT